MMRYLRYQPLKKNGRAYQIFNTTGGKLQAGHKPLFATDLLSKSSLEKHAILMSRNYLRYRYLRYQTVYETWLKSQKWLLFLCESKRFEFCLPHRRPLCHKKVVGPWFLDIVLENCALEDFTGWMRRVSHLVKLQVRYSYIAAIWYNSHYARPYMQIFSIVLNWWALLFPHLDTYVTW